MFLFIFFLAGLWCGKGALDAELGEQNFVSVHLSQWFSASGVHCDNLGGLYTVQVPATHFSPVKLESLGVEPEHSKIILGDSNL